MTFLANLNWLPTQALMKRVGGVKALFDTSFGSGSVAGFSLRVLSKDMVGQPVVKVRRSVDDVEQDILLTKDGLDEDALLDFVVPNTLPGEVSGLTAGFSLRNLSEDYTGAVVKVRRGSDDAEQDFTAAEVSDGTLTTFTGSGDGFVTVWYNQGSGDDAVQGSATAQPKIINNGSLILERGRPIIDFDGVDDYLSFSDAAYSSFASVFTVATRIAGNRYQRFLNIHNGSSNLQLTDRESDLMTQDRRVQDDNDALVWINDMSGLNLISAFFGSSGTSLFNNGDEKTVIDDHRIAGGDDNLSTIGIRSDLATATCCSYNFNEILIYNVDKSSERLAIENNINDYYSIYTDSTVYDGFVTTWYDQSGNDNHAVQSTAASQPLIVSDGVVIRDGGKPTIFFNGGSQGFVGPETNFNGSNDISLFVVSKRTSNQIQFIFEHGANSSFSLGQGSNAANNSEWRFIYISDDNNAVRVFSALNTFQILTGVIRSTSDVNIAINGDDFVSNNFSGSGGFTNQSFGIGVRPPSSFGYEGNITELILYDSDKEGVRTDIEGDLFNYYFDKPSVFTASDWEITVTSSTTSEVEILNYPDDGGLSASVEYRVNGGAVQTANITGDKFTVTAGDSDTVEIRQTSVAGSSSWSDVKSIDVRLWTPADINSELTSWIDTAGATHLVLDDGRITQFTDRSGNNNHATQGSAARQATYDAASQAAQFDGGQLYDAPSFLSTVDAMVMQVASYQLTGESVQYAFFANPPRFYPYRLVGSDFSWLYDETDFTSVPGDTNTHVGGMRHDGTKADAYLDGTVVGSYVGAVAGSPTIRLGGVSTTPRLEGRVREVVCSTSLSDANIEKIEGYLAWKWDGIEASNNLVAKLPASHPYKNNPPVVQL